MLAESQQAPESRHAIGADLPLPLTVSMRRGQLFLHTTIVLAGIALLLSRLGEQRHVFPAHWVILVCVASAVGLALTKIVILRQDGIHIRRVWPTKRTIPYHEVSVVEPRVGGVRLTLNDGSQVPIRLTLPAEHRKRIVRWLQGQARAAAFD